MTTLPRKETTPASTVPTLSSALADRPGGADAADDAGPDQRWPSSLLDAGPVRHRGTVHTGRHTDGQSHE
jgi:hypothetical protein